MNVVTSPAPYNEKPSCSICQSSMFMICSPRCHWIPSVDSILCIVVTGKDVDIGGVRTRFRIVKKVSIQRIDALWFSIITFCPRHPIAGSEAIKADTVPAFLLGRKPKGKHHVFFEPWVKHNRAIGFQSGGVISEFICQFNNRLVSTVVFHRLVKSAMEVARALDQIVVDE